ncbi:MAG: hypothetical protein K0Q73_5368 [Paenibacillus sp.]|jgi:hypothetical protein|nr:hypothetical protein [Paenibacillus sp.]
MNDTDNVMANCSECDRVTPHIRELRKVDESFVDVPIGYCITCLQEGRTPQPKTLFTAQ